MDIETVAEGVETEEQVRFLKQSGCDYIQGYYYSKPVGEEQLKKLLLEEMYNKKDAS